MSEGRDSAWRCSNQTETLEVRRVPVGGGGQARAQPPSLHSSPSSSSSSSSSPAGSSSSSSEDDDEEDSELDAKSDDSELSLEDSASGLEVVILTVSSARGTQAGALLLSAVPQPEASPKGSKQEALG